MSYRVKRNTPSFTFQPHTWLLPASVSDVEDVTGAAGREAEGVEQNLPGQAEDDELVVEILLATLSHLTRPGAAALLAALTPAHSDHLLVLGVLRLLLDVVHDEPPLQVGVASSPGSDKGLQQVTGWAGGFLEKSGLTVSVSVVVTRLGPGLGVLLQQRPQGVSPVQHLHSQLSPATNLLPTLHVTLHLLDEAVRVLQRMFAPIVPANTGIFHC